jgi:hypothetical protein
MKQGLFIPSAVVGILKTIQAGQKTGLNRFRLKS